MNFNALAALVDSLKVWPEPVSLPEALQDATPVQLAEARSRFAQIAACATELRRLIDQELATHLENGKALPYGGDILRQATVGRPKIVDQDSWWRMVALALNKSAEPVVLLAALYPADSVRLTALPKLAEALGVDAATLKETMINYESPTAPLLIQPSYIAPAWTRTLEEGVIGGR